jgi:hypothetical protein
MLKTSRVNASAMRDHHVVMAGAEVNECRSRCACHTPSGPPILPSVQVSSRACINPSFSGIWDPSFAMPRVAYLNNNERQVVGLYIGSDPWTNLTCLAVDIPESLPSNYLHMFGVCSQPLSASLCS